MPVHLVELFEIIEAKQQNAHHIFGILQRRWWKEVVEETLLQAFDLETLYGPEMHELVRRIGLRKSVELRRWD